MKFALPIPESKKISHFQFVDDFLALKKILASFIGQQNYIVITDQNVYRTSPFFQDSFFQKSQILVLPAGENTKSALFLGQVYDFCLKNNLQRKSSIITIGGGVIGDLGGFVASTFMRGVSWINIPTSLLAMVDACLGGKVAINHPQGKNLIGNFYFPAHVLLCVDFLATLPISEIKNGIAEMIKHAIIASPDHFQALWQISQQNLKNIKPLAWQNLIYESLKIKKQIVEADVYEKNIRQYLNLGHSYGHAIEKLSNYSIPHGQAVAMGICQVARWASGKGLLPIDQKNSILTLFDRFNIPTALPFPLSAIQAATKHDKKTKDGRLPIIYPTKIGKVAIFLP